VEQHDRYLAGNGQLAGPHGSTVTAQGSEILSFLDRVLTTFTSSGVTWALLRGRAELATGRDVDLLVAADHQPVAEEIILELGGVPLPQRRYPWHRMYVFDVPAAGASLKLDIVNELIYSRELQIASGLERGCLERRVRDGSLFLLSPTDAFWTILLHCLLDKRQVKGRRADELTSRVDDLDRPSPGEQFFASLCPAGWSPDRAVDHVVRQDWEPLGGLGSQILSLRGADSTTRPGSGNGDRFAPQNARRSPADKAVRRASDALTGAMYRKVWRALGFGFVPDVFDVVEKARVDATVIGLRRRLGRCDVVLVVDDPQLDRLLPVMRRHYRAWSGSWRRTRVVGLETVRIVPRSKLSWDEEQVRGAGDASLALPGWSHCRLGL
jgi:hypothetical protein